MRRILWRVALLGAAALAAVTAWVLAASVTRSIPVLALIALLAFVGVGALLLKVADLARPPADAARARVIRWRWLLGGAVVYVVFAQLAVGRPPQRVVEPIEPVIGAMMWTLDDGARIAYLREPPRAAPRAAPIIFLHDGPGIPALPAYGRSSPRPLDFAADSGFDVYYYDQRGAGLSDRLDLRRTDPYSVALHVQDLEQIREQIGAERVILAGHGWGATLAANYLVEHPDRVDRLLLLSPAPLWYATMPDFVDPATRARISEVEASALAVLERPPLRLLIGRLTATTSRRAAHTLIPDWEADQWWTDAVRQARQLGQPRLTCRSDRSWGLPPLEGLGFFAYSYTVADALNLPDPHERLAGQAPPTLLMRGLCDYVQGRVAQDYLDAIDGALYVAVPGAGHMIWTEQAEFLSRVALPFLLGHDVPLTFYAPRRQPRP